MANGGRQVVSGMRALAIARCAIGGRDDSPVIITDMTNHVTHYELFCVWGQREIVVHVDAQSGAVLDIVTVNFSVPRKE